MVLIVHIGPVRWSRTYRRPRDEEVRTIPGSRRNPAVVGLVRLGAALAIVLGLLGMHVLSHHGATHETAPTVTAPLAAAHHDAAGATHQAPPAHDSTGSGDGGAGGTGHVLGDMVMLCVAMLAVAATLLALLAFIRRVPRLWAVLRPAVTRFRPTGRLTPTGTGPPPVWEFSVIRC